MKTPCGKPLAAFRYSGNKGRMLRYLRRMPPTVTRIIEPFCGSCAYSLNSGLPFVGYDNNPEIIDLLQNLRAHPENVASLQRYVGRRVDVRDLPIAPWEKTYLRINIASVVTGQLSSFLIYPQHRLPELSPATQAALRRGAFVLGDAASAKVEATDGLFIDPPYVGTAGNYAKSSLGVEDVRHKIRTLLEHEVPTVITYGAGAEALLPELSWELLCIRRVPNVRRGGSVPRPEYAAYVNF